MLHVATAAAKHMGSSVHVRVACAQTRFHGVFKLAEGLSHTSRQLLLFNAEVRTLVVAIGASPEHIMSRWIATDASFFPASMVNNVFSAYI